MKSFERIVNAPPEVFRDLPFTAGWKSGLSEAGGNVQRNYIYGSEGVVHVSPLCIGLSDDEALVCQRWASKSKISVLAKNQSTTREWSAKRGVRIPEIRLVGNVVHDGLAYDFWYESFVDGIPLNDAVFNGFGGEGYSRIVDWLSGFHDLFPDNGSLEDYYRQRLMALSRLFAEGERLSTVCTENEARLARRLIAKNLDTLEAAVEARESMRVVHGDLRGGNILVSGSSQFGVIDFEQGNFGGDWFCDLDKLLEYFNNKSPDPTKPFLYRPPLTTNQKTDLTRKYITSRKVGGWTVPGFVSQYLESGDLEQLRRRHDLINFDTIMSFIVLRHAMEWNFHQEVFGGREARGVQYLLEKLRRDYE